jgi:multidrug efflux system membrane fusion protein
LEIALIARGMPDASAGSMPTTTTQATQSRHHWSEGLRLIEHGRRTLARAVIAVLPWLVACGQTSAATPSPPPPSVAVSTVALREIDPAAELTGRIEAIHSVEVRPRVSGYVTSIDYAQGEEVRKGAVLFSIDPRPFQAVVARASGELARARSRAEQTKRELDRAQRLIEAGVASGIERDNADSAASQASAEVQAAQATLASAQLDLEFTRVRAAVDGRAGQALVSIGDFVSAAGPTLLTTLVSVDPVYVYFTADETTFLRFASRSQAASVGIGLADEQGFPHSGKIDFVDNHLDPSAGTIRLRARLDNPERRFTPGLYARVALQEGQPRQAILVDDKAVLTDQDRKFVLLLGPGEVVERRDVKLGPRVDGLRVIADGLKVGDRVIVDGTQRVLPGSKARLAATVALNEPAAGAKAPPGGER